MVFEKQVLFYPGKLLNQCVEEMASVPCDAEWYYANNMIEIRVEGCKRNGIQINTVLIKSKKPMEAYTKAISRDLIYEGLDKW